MNKPKWIALAVAALIAAFLVGFLPQWSRARGLEAELETTRAALEAELAEVRWELELARLEGRLGAALAESQRSNYERARQLMAGFFADLQPRVERVQDPAAREALQSILAERDEIITLLSRAEPEATQRLMLLYTRYFTAVDPAGREGASVTPS